MVRAYFFQAADLRFAVAHGDGKFQLREPFTPPQIFEQIAKGGEGGGREGLDGVLTKLSIPTYAAVPYHIVVGPDGNLWFTEQQGNQIGQIKLPPATAAQQGPVVAQTTFSPKPFELPMSVSFGSDWQVVFDLPKMVRIDHQPDFGFAFYIVTGAKLADPIDGHLVPFPNDFLLWIKSNPDFVTVDATLVTVAGVEGLQIDATPIWKSTTTHLKLLAHIGKWVKRIKLRRRNMAAPLDRYPYLVLHDRHFT